MNNNNTLFTSQVSKLQREHISQLSTIVSKIVVFVVGLENAQDSSFLQSCLDEVYAEEVQKVVQQNYLKLSHDIFYKDTFLLKDCFYCSITPKDKELIVKPSGQFSISSQFSFLFPDLSNQNYEYKQFNLN